MANNFNIILKQIEIMIKKVELNMCDKEYAKGYCIGYINATISNEYEYNELSKIVDDEFN